MKHIIILFFFVLTFGKAGAAWEEKDIPLILGEILEYHVEYKQVSPKLIARSSKIFFQQFDVAKSYLLQNEVDEILLDREEKWKQIAKDFKDRKFSFYRLMFQSVQKSILRAREIRKELERELIFQSEIEPVKGRSYLGYSGDLQLLKTRIKKQMLEFLKEQKQIYSYQPWNLEFRQKVFAFMEKKWQRAENVYLEANENEFVTYVLKALAKSLDAHTAFFNDEEAFQIRTNLEKEFEGLGIICSESLEGVVIKGVIHGSPAEKTGEIACGDFLVSIDGYEITDISYDEVMKRLKSPFKVILKCRRGLIDGGDLFYKVELQSEKIILEDERLQWKIEPFGDGVILVLMLPSFYESNENSSCSVDIQRVIREVKKDNEILGIILDLRENLGGFLQQAVKTAGLFITNGVIVISKYAEGEMRYLRQIDGRVYHQGPLLILTSKASASAAEIVAQALQDYGTALVVGDERTYGKGTIQYQTVTDPHAQSFYKVTVGRYYTVSGRSTQMEGVRADIIVPSRYASYNIGEQFLEYPLPGDFVASAYIDPLTDLDGQSRSWFQKNYLPNLQKKELHWRKMLPVLQKTSKIRLSQDPEFSKDGSNLGQGFVKGQKWDQYDLSMKEAVNIIKDMIRLESE